MDGVIKVKYSPRNDWVEWTYEFATERSKSHTLWIGAEGKFDADRVVAMIEILEREAKEAGIINE